MSHATFIARHSLRLPSRWFVWVFLFSCVVLPHDNGKAQTIPFLRFVAVSHNVGDLKWGAVPRAESYSLYRHYPAQQGFSLIATIADTQYFDTLQRVVCTDTVSYYVEALTPTGFSRSSVVGILYQDNVPTTPCTLRLCSVDTLLNRIRFSWYPSPDTDVIGYYICIGSPCINYDTVWGRLNTSYLCPAELSPDTQYRFRVLAFDSCFQASPLTPSCNNPVISFPDTGCSRHFSCTWNRYVNMPDSVGRYRLHYRLQNQNQWHTFETGFDGPFEFDTVIDDLSVHFVRVYLSVDNVPDTLQALSQLRTRYFDSGDTADYLRIVETDYDEHLPAFTLTIDIDSLYPYPQCYVYRSQGVDSDYVQIATLDRGLPPASQLFFVDRTIRRDARCYVYRVGIPDFCQQWIKYSDTVQLLLPEVYKATAYFPNVIIYGHPQCGTFCPTYLSPLRADYQLDIFTRWGERVFHTTTLGDCWQGTDFSGHPLRQGTYVYKAHVSHADGTVKSYHGTVLLLR